MAYYFIDDGVTSAYVKIDGPMPETGNEDITELTEEEYMAAVGALLEGPFE
jgi:hypothetical protein